MVCLNQSVKACLFVLCKVKGKEKRGAEGSIYTGKWSQCQDAKQWLSYTTTLLPNWSLSYIFITKAFLKPPYYFLIVRY